jgi:hypothetical protein
MLLRYYLVYCPKSSLAQFHIRTEITCGSFKLAIREYSWLDLKLFKLCTKYTLRYFSK